VAAPTRYTFSVEEWHRMGETGLFGEDDRLELLDGDVYQMAAIGSRHMSCVNRLNRILVSSVGAQAIVSVQNPVVLGSDSEPQADLSLLRSRADEYDQAVPRGDETLLVIGEVVPPCRAP